MLNNIRIKKQNSEERGRKRRHKIKELRNKEIEKDVKDVVGHTLPRMSFLPGGDCQDFFHFISWAQKETNLMYLFRYYFLHCNLVT
jgi:hypothetical protein